MILISWLFYQNISWIALTAWFWIHWHSLIESYFHVCFHILSRSPDVCSVHCWILISSIKPCPDQVGAKQILLIIEYIVNEWTQVHILRAILYQTGSFGPYNWPRLCHLNNHTRQSTCSCLFPNTFIQNIFLTTFSITGTMLGVKIKQWDILSLWEISGCVRHLPCPPWPCHSVYGLRQTQKYLQRKVSNEKTNMFRVRGNYALRNTRGFTEAARTE